MDPLHLAIAFLPLALYLLVLGAIHLRGTPKVWSGAFDTAALAAAVSGLFVAGPMDLFLPSASPLSGVWLWLLMLALYALLITLWNLLARPRLVVFNVAVDQLKPVLTEVAGRLDGDFQSTGDTYLLPRLGLQFHLERYLPLHNISLVAIGDEQSISSWRKLRMELSAALAPVRSASRLPGYAFVAVGLAMFVLPLWQLARADRNAVDEAVHDLLRQAPTKAG
jgi:hypothetical protein